MNNPNKPMLVKKLAALDKELFRIIRNIDELESKLFLIAEQEVTELYAELTNLEHLKEHTKDHITGVESALQWEEEIEEVLTNE